MNTTKRFLIAVYLSLGIIVAGTTGYMVIEGWSASDALYMTVITISTVGFGEVQKVSDVGRIFTILLVFFGVGLTLFAAGTVVEFMVEGRLRALMGRRRLEKKIDRLKDHYIVCGYGRIGRVLCNNLSKKPLDVVVVDADHDLVSTMEADGTLFICGDATDEDILTHAGIHRAKGLVAVLARDRDNVFLVLTARQLAPDIQIFARSSQESTKTKLLAAGANHVASPYEMGAISMAQRILRPTVTSFLDLAVSSSRDDIQMEEIPVGFGSHLANVILKDSGIRQKYNLILIAIKKSDGSMLFNPSFETVIRPGDTVLAVGESEKLRELEAVLNV
jgi:voltage-gated potassium channel